MPPTDDQISRYLADPLSFPPEFKNWVVKYLEQHQPSLLIRQLAGTLLPSKIAGYPGSAGKVLAGDGTWPNPPSYIYAYTEFTAAVSITATTEATANTVVTASAVTFDGATPVLIQFSAPHLQPDASAISRAVTVCLYDGSSSIGFITAALTPAGAAMLVPCYAARRLTPSSGAHTYSIRAFVNGGTGSVDAGAGGVGANAPGFIRITKE